MAMKAPPPKASHGSSPPGRQGKPESQMPLQPPKADVEPPWVSEAAGEPPASWFNESMSPASRRPLRALLRPRWTRTYNILDGYFKLSSLGLANRVMLSGTGEGSGQVNGPNRLRRHVFVRHRRKETFRLLLLRKDPGEVSELRSELKGREAVSPSRSRVAEAPTALQPLLHERASSHHQPQGSWLCATSTKTSPWSSRSTTSTISRQETSRRQKK